MSQDFIEFSSPNGRLVQGQMTLQQEIDMETNQKKINADGTPVMGVFFSLAFPKLINGVPNAEYAAFRQQLDLAGATFWPALFPHGANGQSTHPRFSWKYQDGDGVNQKGQSVADKPGFAGHHIIKFATSFEPKCFIEGKFAPEQQLPKPDEVIKKGFWVRVIGVFKSNKATGMQVPGVAIYPSLVSLVGQGEEIRGGIDAAAAFAAAPMGALPPGVGAPLSVPPPVGGAAAPVVTPPAVVVPQMTAPAVAVPTPPAVVVPTPPPAGPVVAPALAAQGVTWAALEGQGWTVDTARAAGHIL